MESKRARLDTSQITNDAMLFNMPVLGPNNKQIQSNLSNIRFQNLTSIVDPSLSNKTNNIIIRNANSRSQINNNGRSVQQAVVLSSSNFQPPTANNIVRLSNQPFNYPGINNNSNNGSNSNHSISIPAIQVRIGCKKFKPVSSVTFKDDGILFTLKDYTFAPVLLNARAIQKCKANIGTFGYPALFLFLESSCMRQIRNIFSLTHKEFSANSLIEFKQCITIFPYITHDTKNSGDQMMFGLKKAFDAMVKRYPRTTPILEIISNEQVIDILLMNSQDKPDSSDTINNNNNNHSNNNNHNNTNSNNNNNNNINNTNNNSNTNSNNRNNAINNNNINNNININNSNNNQNNNSNNSVYNQPRPTQASIATHPSIATSNTPAPLLTIPSDKALWQAMQKNLMRGGLYHVLMPDSQRKYCIWDGLQLVPCLVQNMEVQVSCSYVRFGTCQLSCIGAVKIRSDHNAGIYFTVKGSKSSKPVDVVIGVQDMVVNQIHPSSQHSCIFVSVTPTASERISASLEINSEAANNASGTNASGINAAALNKVFDCNSSEISKKYIMISLNSLNKDQEDALLGMKINLDHYYLKKNAHMFVKLDLSTTLNLLAKIVENSNEGAKRLLDSLVSQGPLALSELMKRFTSDLAISVHNVDDDGDDDDDDDIVMVQQEVGVKCPYTQQVMQEPVRNIKCGHNYEKQAILQFISIKKGNAKCPYAGCANADCLTSEGLEDNVELKEHIRKLDIKKT